MKKTEGIFKELYRLDTKTGAYIIEIALDKYSDIFCEWDPAPYKLRDIDPDLELYLEGCSDDIPFRYPLIVSFTIPKGIREEKIERQARKGLRNGFKFKIYFINKDIAQTNARTLLFILVGFAFLWVATIFPKQLTASVFPSILVEGIFIGGWVFLWEAITLLLFTTSGLYHKSRIYKRLLNSTIVFREIIYDS